jgi:hypothetical protein
LRFVSITIATAVSNTLPVRSPRDLGRGKTFFELIFFERADNATFGMVEEI